MERLTNYESIGGTRSRNTHRKRHGCHYDAPCSLRGYGLTPEIVQETAELAIWVHENGLEKIKEWIKADKEGRLIIVDNAPRKVSPCDTCESGWGKAITTGYDSCFNHCEKLAEYGKQEG